jgi:nicotinamide riboside transporter PnuC
MHLKVIKVYVFYLFVRKYLEEYILCEIKKIIFILCFLKLLLFVLISNSSWA